MSECSYCKKKATMVDSVYGPPLCHCCDDEDCRQQAMEDLFEAAMEDC